MSALVKLIVCVVIGASLQRRCYVAFVQGLDDVHPHEHSSPQHQKHNRLWNDSYIWPAPQYEIYDQFQSTDGTNTTRVIFSNNWKFVYDNSNSSRTNAHHEYGGETTERWSTIMAAANERFQYFLNQSISTTIRKTYNQMDDLKHITSRNILIPLEGIRFHITNLSETTLYHGIDESYVIQILNPSLSHDSILNTSNFIEIASTNVFGAIYALETLKQLIQLVGFSGGESNTGNMRESIPIFGIYNNTFNLYIQDAPTFAYRGIMIDTARHFLPLHLIQQNLYIMLTNKLNVLHWHMSDTQSFPYASIKFPELAQRGAYCYPECTYNTSDIEMIIDTAALLGIHVIVEIDLPTHSQGNKNAQMLFLLELPPIILLTTFLLVHCTAAYLILIAIGNSHPELLSKCSNGVLSEPLNATNEALYDFVYALYDEITLLFTDDYIHLGGDEGG